MGGKGSGRRSSYLSRESKEVHTNYSLAWEQFLKTKDYKRAERVLSSRGMQQPYIDNLLHLPFEAAWHATGTPIKIITTI